MRIFIMRHGQASALSVVDAERPLTTQGIDEVSTMADWLSSLPFEFDQIWVSPFKRAQQTAKTVTSKLNNQEKLTTLNFITPSGSANKMHDFLDGCCNVTDKKTEQRVLIVSHMPLVSYLVAELTQQQACPIFQTAAIAEINYDEVKMTGHLQKMVCPTDFN
ncbi:MAG: phosphohistidine phosphatase SixA [Gammaproteobacteria bacterium]|nr:MAG: phosphohistidine phosphatase SixA [Gammaproteobacteria bacterium]